MSENSYVDQAFQKLHATPEIGFSEFETARFIAGELNRFGYQVAEGVGGTGVTGRMDSGNEGPVLAVRADMDALQFEINGQKVNIHACGHDANSAMVLATAKRISEVGLKSGQLVFVFQPAEEKGAGALAMIDTGLLSDVTEMVGIHLRPRQELKLGEATPQLLHGAVAFMSATIKGLASHGAWPHEGINAVDAAVVAVNAINAVREDPRVSHSAKVTQINTQGSAFNIIPDEVELKIDIRAQTNSVMNGLLDKVKNAIAHAAKSVGAETEINTPIHIVAADYHQDMIQAAEDATKAVLGTFHDPIVTPGTDDFHFFADRLRAKTVYIGLGGDVRPVLHHPEMTFDPMALQHGQNILNKIVHQRLG